MLPEDVDIAAGGAPLAEHPTWSHVDVPGVRRRRPGARPTPSTPSSSRRWYFLRYCTPRDDQQMLGPRGRTTGCRWTSTSAASSTPSCTCSTRASSPRCCATSATLKVDEPFARLLTQGMVCKETYRCAEHDWLLPEEVEGYGQAGATRSCAKCGREATVGPVEKMSKSLKNIVDPDALIDALRRRHRARLHALRLAAREQPRVERRGRRGRARASSARLYRLVWQHHEKVARRGARRRRRTRCAGASHKTLQRVTQDTLERFHFNTAIAAIMELLNALARLPRRRTDEDRAALQGGARARGAHGLALRAAPRRGAVARRWATGVRGRAALADASTRSSARDEKMTIVVQVNGKLRGQVEVAPDAPRGRDQGRGARPSRTCVKHVAGKPPKKVVYVKGRLVNVVV